MQPTDLASLKDDMVAFIAGNGLRRFPAYVPDDIASVMFEDEHPDGWKDFVEHAKAAGAPFVTLSEAVLEKPDVELLIEQLRAQHFPDEAADLDEVEMLVKYVGRTGYLQLGFAQGGVLFLYETSTEWYDRYQQWMETVAEIDEIVVDDGEE